jgi:hypothetical protein
MILAPYDIFRRDLVGTAVWIEAVQDIEVARRRILELAKNSPAEYFVFSQKTQEIVADTRPNFSRLTAA